MNKYITPTIDIINIINTHIIMGSVSSVSSVGSVSSVSSVNWGYCSRWCGMWHVCLDREIGKRCEDYKCKS